MKAIILGASRGIRRLDPSDSYPRALLSDRRGRHLLDWLLVTLRGAGIDDVVFVGGYHIEKLIQDYHQLRYFYNPDWADTGTARSLLCAAAELDGDCLVCHGDILFREDTVERLLAAPGDIVLAVASADVPEAPAAPDALRSLDTFAGMMRMTAEGARRLRDGFNDAARDGPLSAAGLPALAAGLAAAGTEVRCVAVGDHWTEVHRPDDISRFVMGTKAQTLERLRRVVRTAVILDQVRFTVTDWRDDAAAIVDRIMEHFPGQRLVVRSSAVAEDTWTASNSGRFRSVLNVDGGDRTRIAEAVAEVMASFDAAGIQDNRNEVFAQPQIPDVALSGVVLTADLETGAPYVTVNYDARSGRSDGVTAGDVDGLATCYAFRRRLDRIDGPLAGLRRAIEELQEVLAHDALDIEFAIDGAGRCLILQVRPVVGKPGPADPVDERDMAAELELAAGHVRHAMRPLPLLHGDVTALANMTDWNPAEIVGNTPRALALSLYRHLVTDEVWAESRAEMGYRDVRPAPLLNVIAGKPYIDVRASFNSFVPADLPDALAGRLVAAYVERLRAEPRLQDKIEFEIAATCHDFAFDRQAERLRADGLSADDVATLRDGLRRLTHDVVTDARGLYRRDRERLDHLARRRQAILEMEIDEAAALCTAVGLLLDDCRRFGTLPFANQARCGFVASAFLKSLVAAGVMDDAERNRMMGLLPTVAGDFANAFAEMAAGRLDRAEFLRRFGHLRPGTYDILVPSYGEDPDLYLDRVAPPRDAPRHPTDDAAFRDAFLGFEPAVDALCRDAGLGFDARTLLAFIVRAIPAREAVKFEFTRNLSAALTLLRRHAGLLGLSIEEVSHLPIRPLLDARAGKPASRWRRDLRSLAGSNRKHFGISRLLRMPSVIVAPDDVFGFTEEEAWPNYITEKTVVAPVVVIAGPPPAQAIDGHVVAIENADPGYDWLFGHGIAGLVTKYGGVASHMAIRCAEFGLPAAIGCGDQVFERVRRASLVELNGQAGRLEVLR